MKKRISKKRNIIALLILLLLLSLVPYFIFHEKMYAYKLDAHHISLTLKEFVKSNHGSFPSSEDKLIEKGYLKQPSENNNKYKVRYRKETDSWWPCLDYKGMNVRYNFDLSNVKVVDNKLCDKNTNYQILIIEGPYSSYFLKDEYERYSYEIYEEIVSQFNSD
jgi:hypothetical protein